jgi:pimeloyl-ACP methyl ester carboxylesterase
LFAGLRGAMMAAGTPITLSREPSMPKAKANGITLEYELRGNGPPLVMINGFRRSRQAWGKPFVEALEPHFRLVLFDNRGTGGSDRPESGYSMEAFADDTAGLMDTLKLEQAHVFGVSMGGMIAQTFAVRHAERLHGLGLGCTHFGGKRIAKPEEAAWALIRLKPTPEMPPREVARRQDPIYFHPDFVRDHHDVIDAYNDLMAPYAPPVHVMQGHLAAIESFDGEGRLSEIAAPTLVLTGDSDWLIPPENSRRIAQRIPGAKLIVLPQANHLFWVEKPGEAARAIEDFLNNLE